MIDARGLNNLGIGLIDAHRIASVLIAAPTLLWTTDKRLRQLAEISAFRPACPVCHRPNLAMECQRLEDDHERRQAHGELGTDSER